MLGLIALAALCVAADRPGHTGRDSAYWDGVPPKRFRAETTLTVTTLTPQGIADTCNTSGPPPCPLQTEACTIRDHAYLPNPCDPRFANEGFAKLACHEFGHRQGWPWTHGK